MTNNDALDLAIAQLQRELDAIDGLRHKTERTTIITQLDGYWREKRAKFAAAIERLEEMRRAN